MNSVTYYPVATQRQFEINRQKIRNKPYARYFDGNLWLHDATLPALTGPLDASAVLPESDVDRLLDDDVLPGETGYCVLPNGTGYVASRVPFHGVPIEAFRWWWWWHSVESERYTLWYPHNHVSVERDDLDAFTAPGLSDEARYIGSTHVISEYIGPSLEHITIRFVEPATMGFDPARIAARKIVHGCGWVSLQRPKLTICKMVHVARPTDFGFELRSRYWIGTDLKVRTPFGEVGIGPLVRRSPRGNRTAVRKAVYEQLLHDQIEFTHLSTFLGPLFAEFGRGNGTSD